jgi:hypothetical protein
MWTVQEFFILPLIALLFLSTTSVAADCSVKDTEIAKEYAGDCRNGLANGEGKAAGRDKYVGGFRDGLMHGKGTYNWSSGSQYVGDFSDGMMHGKGTYTWTNGSHYIGEYRNNKKNGFGVFTVPRTAYDIKSQGSMGDWKGDFLIQEGLFVDGFFALRCSNKPICERQKRLEDERKDREERERIARACDVFYPGKAFRFKPAGWAYLGTSVDAVVLGLDKSSRLVSIRVEGRNVESSCEQILSQME